MTSEKDLTKKTKDLKIKDDSVINILLLGETGVGKSTIVNSIANYLTYSKFKKAEKEKLQILIPSKCKVKDKNNEYHIIQIGSEEDKNECLDIGMSATQDVKSYLFPIWNGSLKIRFIDTPGIGDVRGIDQDNINCENILSFIGQLHELHAICCLFKPTNTRITAYFEYCLTQILSRLDKSASKNLIFIFTNTRGTDYGPGDTFPSLQKVVENIKATPPHVEIPLNKNNIFCFDNEAFRYLAAIKQNIEYDSSIKDRNSESWKHSVEECNRLIKYIVGDANTPPLKPHHIKSTSAINEARRLIVQLSQPLAEISQLINDNLYILQRHEEDLNSNMDTLSELRKKLYMPVIDLVPIQLTQPVTVCCNKKCAEIYKVGGITKFHYKQRCHDPCYLANVPKEIIGTPELIHCAAINRATKTCIKCQCDFSIHMHVYYETKTVETKIIDNNVKHNMDSKEKVLVNVKKLIANISTRKEELEREHKTIVKTCAKFAHFLQNNAITAYNDSYKDYIDYLILREKSLGVSANLSVICHLQNLLQEYESMKKSFDDALSLQKKIGEADVLITPQKVQEAIQELYQLKHNGKKIKELYDCQKKSRAKEYKHSEYVHEIPSQPEEDKTKLKMEKQQKNTFQKKQYKPAGHHNQRDESHHRGRGQSQQRSRNQSHHRTRDHSPPPAYQDVPPTRQFRPQNQQYHHSDRYRPHPAEQHYYPPDGARQNSYAPSFPMPSVHPYDMPPPGPSASFYDRRQDVRDNEKDSYEVKVYLNRTERSQTPKRQNYNDFPAPHPPSARENFQHGQYQNPINYPSPANYRRPVDYPPPPANYPPPPADYPPPPANYPSPPANYPPHYIHREGNGPRQNQGPHNVRSNERRDNRQRQNWTSNERGNNSNFRQNRQQNDKGDRNFKGSKGVKEQTQKFKRVNVYKHKNQNKSSSDSDSSSE